MALGQSARSGRLRAFVGICAQNYINEQYDLLFLVVGCSRVVVVVVVVVVSWFFVQWIFCMSLLG